MKIKLLSNYDSSENLLRRFRNNYNIFDNDIEFVTDGEYDCAVIFNKPNENILNTAKVIVIVQEPSWSPVWYGNSFDYADHVILHDKTLFEVNQDKVIEMPSIMWFHDHVHYKLFDDVQKSKLKKKKKISMIVSGLNMEIPNTNYSKRIGLLNKILQSDLDIDIYGKGLNITDSRFKGQVDNKFHALIPYEYSIAIENSCEKNYITEKFIDCTLCNTKPIYYGAPNISEVYSWYEPLNLDSDDVIGDLKKIISETPVYENFMRDYDTYFEKFNLYRIIKSLCLQ